jgi:hypothetical protein
MRDPDRIERILEKIGRIWDTCPDLRLGQLLVGAVGNPSKGFDIFYEEDDRLEKELDLIIKEHNLKHIGGLRLDE